jgi:hypothetical protein
MHRWCTVPRTFLIIAKICKYWGRLAVRFVSRASGGAILPLFFSSWWTLMRDLSDQRIRQVYMEYCAKLMSMQKLFRHNPDAEEAGVLVLAACVELRKLLEPHISSEECETLDLQLAYAQA